MAVSQPAACVMVAAMAIGMVATWRKDRNWKETILFGPVYGLVVAGLLAFFGVIVATALGVH